MRILVPEHASGRLGDAWRFCVGTGRFDLALRRDYQDSLALVQQDIGFRHIRGHGLFSDGVGVYRPFEFGGRRVRHVYSYVDQVVDAYLSLGIAPFLELGFMPSELASGPHTVFWWNGNVTPPSSEREWADLVRATLRHLVGRYGLDQVRTWPIEVWNEPDLPDFWGPTRDAGILAGQAAYHRLYEITAAAVKDVDASLPVGGPAISPGADDGWLSRFAAFAVDRGVPVDFVSRHAYTSGPARHIPFGVRQSLAPAAALLDQFAQPRSQLQGTPLAEVPVHITEFNSSYRPDNPVHDTAFQAAYLAPVVTAAGELVDSFAYWTFCDVFEEVGVPASVLHGGFGLLAHRQIKKPAYHLYAFMARLGQQILARGDDHLVTRDESGRIAVLAWSPATVDGGEHRIALSLPMPADRAFVLRSRVNEEMGNAWTAWSRMGRPASPGHWQLDALREAAEPVRSHESRCAEAGRVDLDIVLERNEITLVEVTAVVDETPPGWDDRIVLPRRPQPGEPGAASGGEPS